MPVLALLSPEPSPGRAALEGVAAAVAGRLGLPEGRFWVTWQQVGPDNASGQRPESTGAGPHSPMGFVGCEQNWAPDVVERLLRAVREEVSRLLGVPGDDVSLFVHRTGGGGEPVDGALGTPSEVVALPVGRVVGGRGEVFDDAWGEVSAVIRLDGDRFTPDALAGLDAFSHIEVVYHFDRVPPQKIETGARHPRGNTDWPLVGIFAQRGKNRPNRLGVSRCRLVRTDGLDIHVTGLDAVDGTPVLDIKPYMAEFGPIGDVSQPAWTTEIMRRYY